MSTNSLKETLAECIKATESRMDFWAKFLNSAHSKEVAEIGVWKGDFAAHILKECDSICRYHMIDPWRHLDSWDKPANVDRETFERVFSEAMTKTAFAKEKISVLRGTTVEVIGQIPDESLDFIYVDGDHTLRGICVDLIRSYAKVRPGCYIGGDDFSKSIWQHSPKFEPTLVFPFAVYFAEATGSQIYALPYGQFLMRKRGKSNETYAYEDLTGLYGDLSLRSQFLQRKALIGRVTGLMPAGLRKTLRKRLKRK